MTRTFHRAFLAVLLLAAGPSVAQIGPRASGSAESSHVFAIVPAQIVSVTATNLTSTSGFLVLLNATSTPSDGAIAPLACVALPASGTISIGYYPNTALYNVGVVAVVTSANTCFTKTTGTITAFISGIVQ